MSVVGFDAPRALRTHLSGVPELSGLDLHVYRFPIDPVKHPDPFLFLQDADDRPLRNIHNRVYARRATVTVRVVGRAREGEGTRALAEAAAQACDGTDFTGPQGQSVSCGLIAGPRMLGYLPGPDRPQYTLTVDMAVT